jgi:hypothetical protein
MREMVARQFDPGRRSAESRDFEAGLRREIVRQDEALQAVVYLYQVFRMELDSPGRPVGNLLFLGPTGAGKTRVVGNSHVGPYSATSRATAVLYGQLPGGANEAVLRMLIEIGSTNNVPDYIKRVKVGEKLLMGFGHRV